MMIILDAKIFGSNEIINLMLDETVCVEEALSKIAENNGGSDDNLLVMSCRNKCFISKKLSFKEQGISGGDRLIIIRKEDEG